MRVREGVNERETALMTGRGCRGEGEGVDEREKALMTGRGR